MDWFGLSKLFSIKSWKILLKMVFSKFFPQIVRGKQIHNYSEFVCFLFCGQGISYITCSPKWLPAGMLNTNSSEVTLNCWESICLGVYYQPIYRLEVFYNWVLVGRLYNISVLKNFFEVPERFRGSPWKTNANALI